MHPTACRILLLVAVVVALAGADLREVTPISDRILCLHFDDGRVVRHDVGQRKQMDHAEVAPLMVAALAPGGFTLVSAGHAAYATPTAASALGRKSKGTEFGFTDQNWQTSGAMGAGFYPTTPTYAQEHWIYLTLPVAMQAGASYTVAWNRTALNTDVANASFTFATASLRSEAVHVNTVGYLPDAPQKYGYLYHWAGSLGGIDYSAWNGATFRLVRTSDGGTVFTGTVAFRKSATNRETARDGDTPNANFLGAAVWECDFSAFTTPGSYRLAIDGIGCSYPFRLATDVYLEPFRAVMKGLYQQRSGIALVTPWADEARPAPHNPRLTPGFANRLFYTRMRNIDMTDQEGMAADKSAIEAQRAGNLTDTWGWYQDAGDWDGYITHGKVPIALLMLYLSAPHRFADGQLSLPESANGVPDLLDEAAWLPRYFHRLRHELLTKGWGTGGVGARVAGDAWGGDLVNDVNTGSWGDTARDWYVTGEDPFATYRYATMAALLAESLVVAGTADPEGADWRTEAVQAYAWAQSHTLAGDAAKSYDGPFTDHRALAALALYRLTGTASYHTQFLADSAAWSGELGELAGFAAALYTTLPAGRTADAARLASLRTLLIDGTSPYTTGVTNRALRWGTNWWRPVGTGQATTPYIQPLLEAYLSQRVGDAAAAATTRGTIITTCDYFLGTNPLHTTWITGLGPRPPTGVFNLDDWACGQVQRTGLIPYGPDRVGSPWFWYPLHIPENQSWALDATYPPQLIGVTSSALLGDGVGTWPLHEAWSDLATSPQTGEYTIHQQHLNAAWTYGMLLPDPSAAPVAAPMVSSSSVATPAVSGSGIAGQAVQIRVDGVVRGTVTVATGGTWAWTMAPPLSAGSHVITTTIVSAGNVISAPSPGTTVLVAGPAPVTTPTSSASSAGGGGGACGAGIGAAVMALGLLLALRQRRR